MPCRPGRKPWIRVCARCHAGDDVDGSLRDRRARPRLGHVSLAVQRRRRSIAPDKGDEREEPQRRTTRTWVGTPPRECPKAFRSILHVHPRSAGVREPPSQLPSSDRSRHRHAARQGRSARGLGVPIEQRGCRPTCPDDIAGAVPPRNPGLAMQSTAFVPCRSSLFAARPGPRGSSGSIGAHCTPTARKGASSASSRIEIALECSWAPIERHNLALAPCSGTPARVLTWADEVPTREIRNDPRFAAPKTTVAHAGPGRLTIH